MRESALISLNNANMRTPPCYEPVGTPSPLQKLARKSYPVRKIPWNVISLESYTGLTSHWEKTLKFWGCPLDFELNNWIWNQNRENFHPHFHPQAFIANGDRIKELYTNGYGKSYFLWKNNSRDELSVKFANGDKKIFSRYFYTRGDFWAIFPHGKGRWNERSILYSPLNHKQHCYQTKELVHVRFVTNMRRYQLDQSLAPMKRKKPIKIEYKIGYIIMDH